MNYFAAFFVAVAIAQTPDLTWGNAIVAYGPMGIVLAWFMIRGETKMADIVTELRVLGHRMNGITKAMLADIASRETTGEALRTLVNSELSKLETESEVQAIRSRGKK